MPKDAKGNFRLNSQLARHADKSGMAGAKPHESADGPAYGSPKADGGGNSTTLHDHGDGTFHTDGSAGKMEHPTIGHALMHMAGRHSEGSHVHLHGDMDGVKSHSMKDGGEVEGPTEHGSAEEAGAHAASVLGGEGHASGGADMDDMRSLSGV